MRAAMEGWIFLDVRDKENIIEVDLTNKSVHK